MLVRASIVSLLLIAGCGEAAEVKLTPKEEANRIVDMLGLEEVMLQTLREMDTLMAANAQQAARKQGRELSDEAANYFVALLLAEIDQTMAKQMKEMTAQLYVENYSPETLHAYRLFLETPAGAEIAEKQTAILNSAFAKGEEIGSNAGVIAGQKIGENIKNDIWAVEADEGVKQELASFFSPAPEKQAE